LANATVSGYLFAAAKAGNILEIIFWLKTRAHWRDGTAIGARADACPERRGAHSATVLGFF
jgi:hypothetical protein